MTGNQNPDAFPPDSTLANVPPPPARTPVARRIVLTLLALIIIAAGVGLLGVKSGTANAAGDGYEMKLEYATIARAGLDVPFDVTLTRARKLIEGVPVVVITDGEPVVDSMRKERLSIDDLMTAAREEGIRRFSDVELAVLEANGRISFFTRSADKPDGAPDPPPTGT